MDLLPVQIAVLTIADDAASADRSASAAIRDAATSAGHTVVDDDVVADNQAAIRDQLVRWIAEPAIDVVIVAAAVESEAASAALAPLVMQTIPGFTDLFRWLTFQEIGASAMQSSAEAALCESTFVFVLPAHEAAVRAAMEKLILPQLDARTKPKNLVLQMPRLKIEARKLQAALQAVPSEIPAEKTSTGPGVAPKLPARAKVPTVNTIARKPDDPPTKEIDLARLEKQIALSSQHEAQTKQVKLGEHDAKTKVVDMSAHQAKTKVVDMTGRVLPRLPPGADASATDDADADDEPLTFTQPRRTTTQALPTTGKHPASIGTAPPAPAAPPAKPLPSITTPSFATPISRRTPSTPRSAVTTPVATPITTPPPSPDVQARQRAVTPVSEASSAIAARDHAVTPVKPAPAVTMPASIVARPRPPTAEPVIGRPKPPTVETPVVQAKPRTVETPVRPPRPPTAPPPPPPVRAAPAAMKEPLPTDEQLESIEPIESGEPIEPAAAANASGTAAAGTTDYDAVAAPLSAALTQPPAKRRPTTPPPIDPLAAVTSKPIGVGDLPQGDFVYPVKRSGGALLLKIVLALAVLGLGFFAFVRLYPADDNAQTAAGQQGPAPVPVAVAPSDAAPAVELSPETPPTDTTDVEIDPSAPAPAPVSPARTDKPAKPARPTTRPATKPATTGAVTPPDTTPPDPKTATTEPEADPEPAGDPTCDEVSCVLAKYDRPCCERYRPKDSYTPPSTSTDELDKRMVKAGVEKIKPRVVACGEKTSANGTVRLAVTVGPEGVVKDVSVTESPEQALGECVAAAMRKAKFAKTAKGGEFVYPFVF